MHSEIHPTPIGPTLLIGGLVVIAIAGFLFLLVSIVRNFLAMYPTKGSVQKTAKQVSGKYKKQIDAFIEKSGGNHWGTCESCSSVRDTRKYSRCPSCGGRLIKTCRADMSFTEQQLREYKNCLNYLPMAFSNNVFYNAVGLLTQFRMAQTAKYLSELTDSNADFFQFRCDYCGGEVQLGNHNCPHCGAPFGKDKEFIMRNNIIVQNAGIYILEEDCAELFIDSQHQIRWWLSHGRRGPLPYWEDMQDYISQRNINRKDGVGAHTY